MFIERLDPRRLMAVIPPSGLDATFGDAGQFEFRGHFAADGPITRGDGATFVCGELLRKNSYAVPYVVKIKDDGTADPTFGAGGYARLPFQDVTLLDDPYEPSDSRQSFAFTTVAYDADNDRVYFAAVRRTTYGDGTTLAVTRLTGAGAIDTAFGTRRGTFSYVPPTPAGEYSRASARVTAINPLADGSVVLAVDRQTHTAATYDDRPDGDQSLALFKLRPTGTPDPTYGTGGVTQLLGGTVGPYVDVNGTYAFTRAVRRGFFSDVRTDASGVTHVLLRYEQGVSTGSYEPYYDENDEIEYGRFDIKTRTVSAAGANDAAKAYSWRLFDSTGDTDAESRVAFAGPDGNRVRVLVTGQPHYGATAVLYTFRASGERLARQRLKPAGVDRVFSIAHAPDGHWLAFNDGLITRLKSDFTQDTGFGVDGVATTGNQSVLPLGGLDDGNDTNAYVLADDQGRFVTSSRAGLVRFA